MPTTRQRILDYLNVKQSATAPELAHALALTPANIRHHLQVLSRTGAISAADALRTGFPGKPARVYCLTRQAEANNLARLASALLEGRNSPNAMQELAVRLTPAQNMPSSGLQARLRAAVQTLSAMHYRARWEARAEAPSLIFGHCPYRQILDQHPQLCQLDAALVSRLTGASAQQTLRLAPDGRGGTVCTFKLNQSK